MRWIETPMKVEDPLQGFVGMSDGVRGEEPFTSMEGMVGQGQKSGSLHPPISFFSSPPTQIPYSFIDIFIELLHCSDGVSNQITNN